MNPFDNDKDRNYLFNIASGKSVSDAACDFLLNCYETGKHAHEEFLNECLEDPNRFEENIKRQKVVTFATAVKKQKSTDKDNKIQAIGMMRDLFGSILYLVLQKRVDMATTLRYPLTPYSFVLCHCDGSGLTTAKSRLLKHLETTILPEDPTNINVKIIDSIFYLHQQANLLPSRYGGVSEHILRSICRSEGKIIHLVFDKTVSPSIKDTERNEGSSEVRSVPFVIAGPGQTRPSKWQQALRSDVFKNEIVQFLINSWAGEKYVNILGEKVLYANCGDICYSYKVVDGQVIRRIEPLLFSTHEEADSRMLFHLTSTDTSGEVVIRTNDTDVLIALLGCYERLRHDINVWLEMGLQRSNNNLRYVTVSKMYLKLRSTLSRALLGLHALTGSDYTVAFSRKGKITRFVQIKKHRRSTCLWIFGVSEEVSPENVLKIEKFVCEFVWLQELFLH